MNDSVFPIYGETNPAPNDIPVDKVYRYGSVTELNPEKEQYYRELHATTWGGVQNMIRECNIRNYNIFIASLNKKRYLFSYYEYTGSDLNADMTRMAEDEVTQQWWNETDPCQRRIDGTPEGEQWLQLERLFFQK